MISVVQFLTSSLVLLIAGPSLAQAQNQVPSAPSTSYSTTSYSSIDDSPDVGQSNFQLTINYGTGSLTLETNGKRNLTRPANTEAYEDGQPVSGTYAEGSVKQLRTIASAILPLRNRTYMLGLGLENLDIGVGGTPMSKTGGTEGSLHMSSVVFEAGALRSFNRWGQALVSVSYDHTLGGKLRSRYQAQTARAGTTSSFATVEDQIQSGSRLTIAGNYQFHLLPGFAMGLFTAAQYGVIRFEDRKEASSIYGYTLGLSLLLKI